VLDVDLMKALASDKRLLVLDWLRDPPTHFRRSATVTWSATGSVRCSSPTSSA